jgi:ketosteroid isomerase-like protein
MVNAFGRLATLATAVVVGSSIFYSAAYLHSPPMQGEMSVREQNLVESAYKAYLRAWKDKDYAALDRLLSDDYKAVNFRGVVSTKANEIATAKEDRDYAEMKGDVMSVTLFGDCAVASGLIDASWRDEQGKTQQITVRFLAVLRRQKGEWKLVATQSTRFNKPSNG